MWDGGWRTLAIFFSPALPAVLVYCFFYPKQSMIGAACILGVGIVTWHIFSEQMTENDVKEA